MLDLAVTHINRLRPTFVVVLGDLTNCFPAPEGDDEVQARQVKDFKASIAKVDADIPLVFVSGNHDVGNVARPETVRAYVERFGDDYFEFHARGVHGLVLNTQMFENAQHVQEGLEAQKRWLEQKLEKPPAAPVRHRLIFGHIPPFIFEADEPNGYFNIDVEKRQELLKLARSGGVGQWYCGHYHRNAGGVDPDGGMEVVTSSATGSVISPSGKNPLGIESCGTASCSASESGLRIVKVYEDRLEHTWYTLDQVPESVELA